MKKNNNRSSSNKILNQRYVIPIVAGICLLVSISLFEIARSWEHQLIEHEFELGCLKTPLLGQICCPVFGPRKYRS